MIPIRCFNIFVKTWLERFRDYRLRALWSEEYCGAIFNGQEKNLTSAGFSLLKVMKKAKSGYLIVVCLGFLSNGPVEAQNTIYDGFVPLESYYGTSSVALSGSNGARVSGDVNQWRVNPGLLSGALHGKVGFNSSFYPSKISAFSLASVLKLDSIWPLGIQVGRTSFGETDRYDVEGRNIGTFRSGTSAVSLGTSRQLSQDVSIGVVMNYHWRSIDTYNAHLLSFDIGGAYRIGESSSIGLSISHLGYEIVPFESERSDIDWDLSIYGSRQLQYLPLELFVKFQRLNYWNRLEYDNSFEEVQNDLGNEASEPSRLQNLVREVFAHMVFGGELAFGQPKKFWLRFSYDHLQNLQLGIENIRSLEGVALGFGIALSKLKVDYSWERLYFDSGVHHISLSMNLFEETNKTVVPRKF